MFWWFFCCLFCATISASSAFSTCNGLRFDFEVFDKNNEKLFAISGAVGLAPSVDATGGSHVTFRNFSWIHDERLTVLDFGYFDYLDNQWHYLADKAQEEWRIEHPAEGLSLYVSVIKDGFFYEMSDNDMLMLSNGTAFQNVGTLMKSGDCIGQYQNGKGFNYTISTCCTDQRAIVLPGDFAKCEQVTSHTFIQSTSTLVANIVVQYNITPTGISFAEVSSVLPRNSSSVVLFNQDFSPEGFIAFAAGQASQYDFALQTDFGVGYAPIGSLFWTGTGAYLLDASSANSCSHRLIQAKGFRTQTDFCCSKLTSS